MVDIHAHIIPDVDDGSPDLTDSMLMVDLALESGVDTVFATPHSHVYWEGPEKHLEHIKNNFMLLRRTIREKKRPLKLMPGMEIFCTDDLKELLEENWVFPLGNTDRYLIEFPFGESAAVCRSHIETVLDYGKPIIAHPERYECIQKLDGEAQRWISMGCQLQINKGSVFGRFGRHAAKAAMYMLKEDLVTYVASDAHSPYRRTTHMGDIREFLEEEYSEGYALRLLEDNPKQYLCI